MTRKLWNVTYEIVTPESAEYGDAEEHGFVAQNVSFRDALNYWDGMHCHVEANCYPVNNRGRICVCPRWFTAYKVNDGTRDYYETGAEESRDLHIPDHITPSSRLRIARLIGCDGL